MLDTKTVIDIVLMYSNQMSMQEIARTLRLSRATVKKYVELNSGVFNDRAIDLLKRGFIPKEFVEPISVTRLYKPKVYGDKELAFIADLLEQEKKIKSGKKHSRYHLFRIAKQNGFKGCYNTFSNAIKRLENKH